METIHKVKNSHQSAEKISKATKKSAGSVVLLYMWCWTKILMLRVEM